MKTIKPFLLLPAEQINSRIACYRYIHATTQIKTDKKPLNKRLFIGLVMKLTITI